MCPSWFRAQATLAALMFCRMCVKRNVCLWKETYQGDRPLLIPARMFGKICEKRCIYVKWDLQRRFASYDIVHQPHSLKNVKRNVYMWKETYKGVKRDLWRRSTSCDITHQPHSPRSYVSFVKETYKREYVLQKRPIILRSLLIVATPYSIQVHSHCLQERWGAGVEYHFQEISWNLRPVVNGT